MSNQAKRRLRGQGKKNYDIKLSFASVDQAGNEANRIAWSKAGRERILNRFTASHQAEGLARGLAAMGVDVETTDLEMLPGLDPA